VVEHETRRRLVRRRSRSSWLGACAGAYGVDLSAYHGFTLERPRGKNIIRVDLERKDVLVRTAESEEAVNSKKDRTEQSKSVRHWNNEEGRVAARRHERWEVSKKKTRKREYL
jgi:hypothetical protein